MTKVNLNELDLMEFIGKEDEKQHCKATFPLFAVHGTNDLATVYFELEPGDNLGKHTDSAEELLIILEGDLIAEIENEFSNVSKGSIALVPKMAPHNLVNVGKTTARVLGVFGGANHIMATFEKEWLPTHANVVNTEQMA